jgi:C4-dicarboxylate transporter DctM subunit
MIGISLVLLLAFLLSSAFVAVALGGLGLALAQVYSFAPLHRALGDLAWGASADILLVSIPFYILLGEILLRAGIAERMYQVIAQWLSWLPGGLMHSNIGASMMFAAVSGSSVATAATVGTVSLPLIGRYGYSERLFCGSVAAGGTLGILIPPSINLIVYGFLTQTSVPALYLAGFVPGILLGLLFMVTIAIACLIRPALGGRAVVTSWEERIRGLPDLIPPIILFVIVIGSIYAGLATPTESASLGVIGALTLAAARGALTCRMLREAIMGCMRTTGMVMFIILAAWFLNFVLSAIGLTAQLNSLVFDQKLAPMTLLLLVIVFYLILGCFMEPMPLMVITVPTVTPVMVAAGFDPVWFGIVIVLLIETAMITPPVGTNLFVVQGMRSRGSISDVIISVLPFVGALLVMLLLVVVFPEIALWLPRLLQ